MSHMLYSTADIDPASSNLALGSGWNDCLWSSLVCCQGWWWWRAMVLFWGTKQTNIYKYIMKYSYNIYCICVFMDTYVYECREIEIPSYAFTFMLKMAVASKMHVRCWCILILILYFMDVERCQGSLMIFCAIGQVTSMSTQLGSSKNTGNCCLLVDM